MAFNYAQMQRTAASLITNFGGRGVLRRAGLKDRPIQCVVIDYKPEEQGLVNTGARRCLVSRIDPVTRAPMKIPPDHLLDKVVFAGEVLRIVKPDTGPRPNGTIVYHDLEVLYDSRAV